MRLQQFLAAAGLGSRRHCEEYILAGRISVNDVVVDALGSQVDPRTDRVALDGEPLRVTPRKYYALYKPSGYLCTHRDPGGRRRVVDLFPAQGPRLFTVGRLDENSEGLLLVTNDGEWAHQLAHPRYRIDRVYLVQVAGQPDRETLASLTQGLYFAEGRFKAESVRIVKTQGKSTLLELRLREGQNREVRRLLARIGHKVMKLRRIAFGPIRLGRMKPGELRPLRPQEVQTLRELLLKSGGEAPPRPRRRTRSRPAGHGGSPVGTPRRRTGAPAPRSQTGPPQTTAGGQTRGRSSTRTRRTDRRRRSSS
jgi:23S rRNA pseudouridine2605 synthase